jgi:hypothetical protein
MNDLLRWIGRLTGVAGALLCAVAGGVRATGQFWLGTFQLGTLLLGGIAIMLAGCVCMLWVLVSRAGPRS